MDNIVDNKITENLSSCCVHLLWRAFSHTVSFYIHQSLHCYTTI